MTFAFFLLKWFFRKVMKEKGECTVVVFIPLLCNLKLPFNKFYWPKPHDVKILKTVTTINEYVTYTEAEFP